MKASNRKVPPQERAIHGVLHSGCNRLNRSKAAAAATDPNINGMARVSSHQPKLICRESPWAFFSQNSRFVCASAAMGGIYPLVAKCKEVER